MNSSSKVRVAVLRGGPSSEYDVSLKSGEQILSHLRDMPEAYEPLDLFISRGGEWHRNGLVEDPHRALRHVDVVWNALHGSYGEDGQVQKLLTSLHIPFTGSGAFASALSMDKDMTKRLYRQHSLLTPTHELITENNLNDGLLINIFRNYLHPVIVKPSSGGSSIGMHLAYSFGELEEAIKEAFKHSNRVLVEEYIRGTEASCIVLDEAKGEKIYAFLPAGRIKLRLTTDEGKQIEDMARLAHQSLGLRHYSSSDFIITPKRKIYILETNSLPALHENSLAHNSFKATGWRPRDFVDHILKLAM